MARFVGSLDANVVLRLLIGDVADQHAVAVKLLYSAIDKQFAVADTALIEVIFVLERNYKLSRPKIAEMILGLLSLWQINANRVLFEKALPIFVKNRSLSFEDCALSVYAECEDASPLWTFDKTLAKQVKNAQLLVNA